MKWSHILKTVLTKWGLSPPNAMVKHIYTHTLDADQCSAVACWCGPCQCLPIPPASCDWPAQDEIDIMEYTPLRPHYSAGSHTAVGRLWEGDNRDK